MKFEIKNRYTGSVIFSCDLSDEVSCQSDGMRLGFAVRAALESDAELRDANLRGAYLPYAELYGADLCGADLRDAYLYYADLSGAILRSANLCGANLRGAILRSADLRGADLRGADLRYAYLRYAYLPYADLRGTDLSRAILRSANLRGADLRDADLSGADLTPIRDDFWAVLSAAPKEVEGLRRALIEGRVDGSTYRGECACLVGTIANLRGEHYQSLRRITPDADRPIERFFMGIVRGDTPETNQAACIVLGWLDEWVGNMREAFGK